MTDTVKILKQKTDVRSQRTELGISGIIHKFPEICVLIVGWVKTRRCNVGFLRLRRINPTYSISVALVGFRSGFNPAKPGH